jgi:hypothetical protein
MLRLFELVEFPFLNLIASCSCKDIFAFGLGLAKKTKKK